MIRILTWLLATALFAAMIHIAYVLFAPPYEMSRLIGQSIKTAGINNFSVLDADAQELILKESSGTAVAGLCPFDLAQGSLVFDAALPDTIWSFAIYGDDGKDVYAINEAQAGTNRFRLTIKRSSGLIQSLLGDNGDTGAANDSWTTTMTSRRGLAIMWVALDDRSLRNSYAETIKQSSCRIESEIGSQKPEIRNQKSEG